MTGSLQVKRGIIHMVINTYEGNKRKPTWISTGLPEKGNLRRAEQMLRETISKMEKQPKLSKNQAEVRDAPFADYIRYWLGAAKEDIDPVTYEGYETLANTHVIPYFETLGVKLKDVTTEILQAYVDQKSKRGRMDGKGGLSPRTVRMHKNIFNQALVKAVDEGLIVKNPCNAVHLPKSQRREYQVFTAEELQELYKALEGDPLLPLIQVTAYFGLRRSEVLGLQWDSVDFRRSLLTIRHTVCKVNTIVRKDKTKTASSYRSFPLYDDMLALFQRIKAQQDSNRRKFGKQYIESDYVFTWPNGQPYRPDYISKRFSSLLLQHDFPHIRFHELRHSCASLLLSAGKQLKDVQEWLGHADIQMTANIYGHLDVARKREIADVMSQKLAVKAPVAS